MPRKHTTSANTNLTPEQMEVLRQLSSTEGIASYLRRLIEQDAVARGIEWPGMVERGKHNRPANDL